MPSATPNAAGLADFEEMRTATAAAWDAVWATEVIPKAARVATEAAAWATEAAARSAAEAAAEAVSWDAARDDIWIAWTAERRAQAKILHRMLTRGAGAIERENNRGQG